MKKNKRNKRKINKFRVITFFGILFIVGLIIYKIYTANITNIVIIGNSYYKDQEIIDMAGLSDYPKSIKNLWFEIEKRLKDDSYILDANVKMNVFLNKVTITVKENYPLFFYASQNVTVLYDGKKVDEKYNLLTVINKIPDTVYDKFLKNIREIDLDIKLRMSEIEYKPNEVDQERFLILMNDGNHVYINIRKFKNINKYLNMIKSFNDKKGILYLDSGEYFDVFDE